jgi:5-methyltetrahydropteroyltriglutamate--homocysteine methyltransferase
LIEANRVRESGVGADESRFQDQLRSSVAEVVRLQKQAGITIPGDGEFGKSMGHKVNYRAWWSYSFQRLGGLELGTTRSLTTCRLSDPGPAKSC